MTISFYGNKYELFFSNNLSPLLALNYADELFFNEFQNLCGKKYRILSIIRKGWQQKYGFLSDINELKSHFETKIDENWVDNILEQYDKKSSELRNILSDFSKNNHSSLGVIDTVKFIREKSAALDAMSNMLHLFSSLVGYEFFKNLRKYSENADEINKNFIFFTQPIRESRYAKKLFDLKDKFKLSKHDTSFSKILRVGAYIKDDVSELLELRSHSLENLFKEISTRLECNPDDLNYLQISEICNFLTEKKDVKELVTERKRVTVLYYPKNKLEVYEGEEAARLLNKGKFKEIFEKQSLSELHGQVASLGIAKGKVIIARNSRQAMKLRKGEILIAPYTAAEYLPAMKKASAIITETGGITSHAAIVARELKIPCIIGVDEVTKIMSNKDRVIVDANKGIIKKI